MTKKELDEMISNLELYIENWKQFYNFINLVRERRASADKKPFSIEEENQFLDVKSLIIQQLESILAYFPAESPPINREEVYNVVTPVSSLRSMMEISDGSLRGIETQWHKIFIELQSLIGQAKIERQKMESKSIFGFLFRK